jgi:hypothetical protein
MAGDGVGYGTFDNTNLFDWSGAVTIEFSLRGNPLGGCKILGDRPVSNIGGIDVAISANADGVVDFRTYGALGLTAGTILTANVSDLEWYNLCYQRSATGEWNIFIDGSHKASATESDGLLTTASAELFRIFDVPDGGLAPYLGQLDYIRITNGVERYPLTGYTPSFPFGTEQADYPPVINMNVNTPDGWREMLPRSKVIPDWVSGNTVYPQQIVVDQGWTGAAIVETTERPAPQAVGDPYYPTDGAVWDVSNSQVSSVEVRNIYTVAQEFFFEYILLNVVSQNIGKNHTLVVILDGTVVSSVTFVPDSSGLIPLGTGSIIVVAGTVLEVSITVSGTGQLYWAENLGFWTTYVLPAELSDVQGQKDGGPVTDDAYGIDILLQPADISQDYKIISAPSGSTAGGGGGGGASSLNDLTDVTLTAPAGTEVLTYDNGTSQWINAPASGGGASTFTDLTDTPPNYTNQADKNLVVTAAADGVEFRDAPAGVLPPFPDKVAGEPIVVLAIGDININSGKSFVGTSWEDNYVSNPNVYEWGTDPITPAGRLWRVPDLAGPEKTDHVLSLYCGFRQGNVSSAIWSMCDAIQRASGRDIYVLNIGDIGFLLADCLFGDSGFWTLEVVSTGAVVPPNPGEARYIVDTGILTVHETDSRGTTTTIKSLTLAAGSKMDVNYQEGVSTGVWDFTSGDTGGVDYIQVTATTTSPITSAGIEREISFYAPTGTISEFVDARIKESLADVAFPGAEQFVDVVVTNFGANEAISDQLATVFSRQWVAQLRNAFEVADYAKTFNTEWHAVNIPWIANNFQYNPVGAVEPPLLFQGYYYVDTNTNERVRVHSTEALATFKSGGIDYDINGHTQLGYNLAYSILIGPTTQTFASTSWETIANPDPLVSPYDIFSVNYGGRVAINVQDPSSIEDYTFFVEGRSIDDQCFKFTTPLIDDPGDLYDRKLTFEASLIGAPFGVGFPLSIATVLCSHQLSFNSGFKVDVGHEAGNNGATFFRQQYNSTADQIAGLALIPTTLTAGTISSGYLGDAAAGDTDTPPVGSVAVAVDPASGRLYRGSAVLTATEVEWVKQESFPISVSQVSTTDAIFTNIKTVTMSGGDAFYGRALFAAERTDGTDYYSANVAFHAFYDAAAIERDSVIYELGPAGMAVNITTLGNDLLFEVKGMSMQNWDWTLLVFERDF